MRCLSVIISVIIVTTVVVLIMIRDRMRFTSVKIEVNCLFSDSESLQVLRQLQGVDHS